MIAYFLVMNSKRCKQGTLDASHVGAEGGGSERGRKTKHYI